VFAALPARCEFADVHLQDGCQRRAGGGRTGGLGLVLAGERRGCGVGGGDGARLPATRVRAAGGRGLHDVLQRGKVAFYTYAENNVAWHGLARSLGVVAFARGVAYT
jgi:hypothetical protein